MNIVPRMPRIVCPSYSIYSVECLAREIRRTPPPFNTRRSEPGSAGSGQIPIQAIGSVFPSLGGHQSKTTVNNHPCQMRRNCGPYFIMIAFCFELLELNSQFILVDTHKNVPKSKEEEVVSLTVGFLVEL